MWEIDTGRERERERERGGREEKREEWFFLTGDTRYPKE
jgi:hypothetical protein